MGTFWDRAAHSVDHICTFFLYFDYLYFLLFHVLVFGAGVGL